MDPITVLSLVCGVIQIVDTSMEVAKKCRELYKNGAPSEDREIENMAKYLVDLYQNLDHRAQAGPGGLQDLCSKCSNTAQQLCTEVQKLKVNGPHRKREAVVKTVKAVWKRSIIDDIQKQLDGYQRILDSYILVELRKSLRVSALQQSEEIANVDQKLQTIITNLAQSPQTFEDLRALLRRQNESIKKYIADDRQQHRGEQDRERYCQRFLESLYYPEIYRRQDTIMEAHQKTFQWVYDPDSFNMSARPWDSIAEWLESGEGIYWINGKAGSGKSTLMNYLSYHDRTSELLGVWSGTKKVLSPKYFFWSSGTTLEKSNEGLLRSLLYQIFRELPSLIPLSCETRSTSVSAEGCPDDFEPIATWTVRRLQKTFQTAIRQAETKYRICIFIDGLDEISGDPDTMIAEISNMPSSGIKVCLSSRPERSYSDAFGSYAKLRLQDLTESDVRVYVADRLEPWLRTEPEGEVSKMMNDIAHKAQGVFLWVDLMVKALLKGLKDDDSLEQLQERVSSTPSDIQAVYANMLSKIDEVHYKEAASLFQMALVGLTESLLDIALALYDHSDRVSEIPVSDTLKLCHRTQSRIPTVCGGLLDIDLEENDTQVEGGLFGSECHYLCLPMRYTSSPDTAKLSFFERYVHVNFIHRTASEFLSQNKQGQSFLDEYPQSHPNPYASIVRARLAKVRLLGLPEKPLNMDYMFEEALNIARESIKDGGDPLYVRALTGEKKWDHVRDRIARGFIHGLMTLLCSDERLTSSASVSLCHDVDRTLTAVNRRSQVIPLFAHWSMRWGLRALRAWELPYPLEWCLLFGGYSKSKHPDAHTPEMESGPFPDSRPVDFLGYAASWSLSCYVFGELDKQKKPIEEKYATHLLCCSMWAFVYACRHGVEKARLAKSLDLVANLLNCGANPNTYIGDFSATIWGYFIRIAPWSYTKLQGKLVMATKSFVENGADIHMNLLSEKTYFWESPKREDPLEDGSLTITLSREMSILHYLHPQSDIAKIILSLGGRDYSNYNCISVKPQGNQMSKRQHDKWLAVLNSGNVDGIDHGKQWNFVVQFKKFYEDNSEEDEDFDIQIDWEGDDYLHIDFEHLKFFESVQIQAKADPEDCQPIEG